MVPAYNEESSIRAVLDRVPEHILGREVRAVVVVDGATDNTERVVLEVGFPVASHAVNRGQGDALATGFEIARLEQADVVVHLDADGQYQPEEIESLIEPVLADEADFVLGSRLLGFYEETGSYRHFGVLLFSRFISMLAGNRVTDCTNGFRAIRGSEVRKLELQEEQFSATELILEAVRNRLRGQEPAPHPGGPHNHAEAHGRQEQEAGPGGLSPGRPASDDPDLAPLRSLSASQLLGESAIRRWHPFCRVALAGQREAATSW